MATFKFDLTKIVKNVADKPQKLEAALSLYGNVSAKKLESSAKRNAPWENDSGRARAGLTGESKRIPGGVRLTLSHGVDYGIYLEVCKEKKYAIIKPTIDTESDAIYRGLRAVWGKV